MFSCFYVANFGVTCLGCGMQRAFIALLRGDLAASLAIYPALLPFIGMMFFLPVHLVFRLKHGAAILKYSFIFTSSLIVLNYIIKLVA